MGELEELIEDMGEKPKENEELEITEEKAEVKTEKEKKTKTLNKQIEQVKEDVKKDIKLKLDGDREIWDTIIKRVAGLQDDIILEITKEGLHSMVIDETNVAMVDLNVPKSAFNEYSVSHNMKIGISIPTLQKHLKVFKKDLTITNGKNQLLMKGGSGQEAKMGLLHIGDLGAELPEVQFSVEMKTPAEKIQKMISVGDDFGREELRFAVKNALFHIFVKSDTEEVRFPICSVKKLDKSGDFNTLYSIEYLKSIMNFKDKDELIVRFGEDTPINVEFDDKLHSVSYILAPKIESD